MGQLLADLFGPDLPQYVVHPSSFRATASRGASVMGRQFSGGTQ